MFPLRKESSFSLLLRMWASRRFTFAIPENGTTSLRSNIRSTLPTDPSSVARSISRSPMKKGTAGDFVIITAASSSVGLAAIQIVKAQGGISIATTRTSAKKDKLIESGADATLLCSILESLRK
jgi:NADPH:quinone reductase-like Zn-dependent oxidoreductase